MESKRCVDPVAYVVQIHYAGNFPWQAEPTDGSQIAAHYEAISRRIDSLPC